MAVSKTTTKEPQPTPEEQFRQDHLALLQAIPPITKDKTAEVRGKAKGSGKDYSYTYGYEDLALVMEVIRPLLVAHNFALYHQVTEHHVLQTVLVHATGGRLTTCWPLADLQDPQARGSEHTYARRYNIKDLLNIPTEEDDDGARAADQHRTQQAQSRAKDAAKTQQPRGSGQTAAQKAGDFTIQHCDANGEIQEAHYQRTPAGIKSMIERFETSMDHEPQIWFANRDVVLEVYHKAKAVEIFSPSMGNMTFGEWCETLNNRMGQPEGQQGSE